MVEYNFERENCFNECLKKKEEIFYLISFIFWIDVIISNFSLSFEVFYFKKCFIFE